MSIGAAIAATRPNRREARKQAVNKLLKSRLRASRSARTALKVGTKMLLNGPLSKMICKKLGMEKANTKASMAAVAPNSQA
jgi:hypothetical protein